MLKEYVLQAPITGEAFTTDASEGYTYLTKLISGNSTAGAKVQSNAALKNGRLNYKSLKYHYEGVGVNSIDIL